jgi:hypothetical protein
MMCTYDPTNVDPYLDFLATLATPAHALKERNTKSVTFSAEPRCSQYNDWLRTLLPSGVAIPTSRSLRLPDENDFSLLARCIRYAKSSSEKQVCWAVHPTHVALIQERTNKYGDGV